MVAIISARSLFTLLAVVVNASLVFAVPVPGSGHGHTTSINTKDASPLALRDPVPHNAYLPTTHGLPTAPQQLAPVEGHSHHPSPITVHGLHDEVAAAIHRRELAYEMLEILERRGKGTDRLRKAASKISLSNAFKKKDKYEPPPTTQCPSCHEHIHNDQFQAHCGPCHDRKQAEAARPKTPPTPHENKRESQLYNPDHYKTW